MNNSKNIIFAITCFAGSIQTSNTLILEALELTSLLKFQQVDQTIEEIKYLEKPQVNMARLRQLVNNFNLDKKNKLILPKSLKELNELKEMLENLPVEMELKFTNPQYDRFRDNPKNLLQDVIYEIEAIQALTDYINYIYVEINNNLLKPTELYDKLFKFLHFYLKRQDPDIEIVLDQPNNINTLISIKNISSNITQKIQELWEKFIETKIDIESRLYIEEDSDNQIVIKYKNDTTKSIITDLLATIPKHGLQISLLTENKDLIKHYTPEELLNNLS